MTTLTDAEREALTWCIATEACIHTGRVDENTVTGCRDCEAIGQAAATATERIVSAREASLRDRLAAAIEQAAPSPGDAYAREHLGYLRDGMTSAARIVRSFDTDHDFLPVAGHPDDDECTYRSDGTDTTYCGRPAADHEHHPNCYQSTGAIPNDLPDDLCDCRVLRMIDAHRALTEKEQGRG